MDLIYVSIGQVDVRTNSVEEICVASTTSTEPIHSVCSEGFGGQDGDTNTLNTQNVHSTQNVQNTQNVLSTQNVQNVLTTPELQESALSDVVTDPALIEQASGHKPGSTIEVL